MSFKKNILTIRHNAGNMTIIPGLKIITTFDWLKPRV
jgi:hypothetical protein